MDFSLANLLLTAYVVIDAKFNLELDDALFRPGVPVGSIVIDHREGAPSMRKIKQDVLDVTSRDEVGRAAD